MLGQVASAWIPAWDGMIGRGVNGQTVRTGRPLLRERLRDFHRQQVFALDIGWYCRIGSSYQQYGAGGVPHHSSGNRCQTSWAQASWGPYVDHQDAVSRRRPARAVGIDCPGVPGSLRCRWGTARCIPMPGCRRWCRSHSWTRPRLWRSADRS